MDEKYSKDICLKLLKAENEKDVEHYVNSCQEMEDPNNWLPLDGRDTNFNITSNQASNGAKALTELMTNMVDAVLMKQAHIRDIDPKGEDAPKTMYEAVGKLLDKKIHGGKLTSLDTKDPWLKEFALENLVIAITGTKYKKDGNPCFTFVDHGEGQKPEDFEQTFLSLSEGHKKSIKFVQGKYNMGSSGVLGYCGKNGYKLIISRRFNQKDGKWGWTLMRKRPDFNDELPTPVAEYFTLQGMIPSFYEDIIHPFHTQNKERYENVNLDTGTIIKLFDYRCGEGNVYDAINSRLTFFENLTETLLPFRILDFRLTPDNRNKDRKMGVDSKRFCGMEFLLLDSHSEQYDQTEEVTSERKISVGSTRNPKLGEVGVYAFFLKKELPKWLKGNRNRRIFHAVNGQVQYKQTRGYLNKCKLEGLKDRIVIIVDASKLTDRARNEIWKGDREHIRETPLAVLYQEEVQEIIESSEELKDLQRQVRDEELENATKVGGNEIFQKLVDSDPMLAGLLSMKDPTLSTRNDDGNYGTGGNDSSEWNGKYSPTSIELVGKAREMNIPINKGRPIKTETDVENDYFTRADNQGQWIFDQRVADSFSIRGSLRNGKLTFFLEPLEDRVSVGDAFTTTIRLEDASMPQSVETEEFTLHIVDSVKDKREHNPASRKHPVNQRGLPSFRLLTKDGREIEGYNCEQWPEGFNDYDGGRVDSLGEEERIYKINYDNTYLIESRRKKKGIDKKVWMKNIF